MILAPVRPALALLLALLLGGCGGGGAEEARGAGGAGVAGEARTLEWIDLLPDADFEALMNPPAWLDEIEEGSEDDLLAYERFQGDEVGRRYWAALNSRQTLPELHGIRARIPGFVVPLEFDARNRVTEFFLVPYFGACIHLPPPPPNQMIHVRYDAGLVLDRLEDAFWIEGELETVIRDHALGTAAWGITASGIRPWPDD